MIDTELMSEIEDFCKLNEMEVADTLNKALRGGFTTLKYGATPISAKREKETVEVIKTIEVEKIVEVEVEKIVKVSDDTKTNELLGEIDVLSKKLAECSKNLRETHEEYEKKMKLLKLEIKNNKKKDIYGEYDD